MSTTLVMKLPVVLSERELAARAAELAREVRKGKEVEDEKKTTMADFKARTEAIDMKVRELSEIVDTKQEDRSVECIVDPDYAAGTMVTVRRDTGEVVQSRPMTQDERQIHLFGPRGVTETARDIIDRAIPEGATMTVSTPGGEPVTLTREGGRRKR